MTPETSPAKAMPFQNAAARVALTKLSDRFASTYFRPALRIQAGNVASSSVGVQPAVAMSHLDSPMLSRFDAVDQAGGAAWTAMIARHLGA